MHRHLIVMKGKGHTIPLEAAKKIVEKYPSCSGVGVIHNGDLIAQGSKDPLTAEKLVKTSEKFKDRGMVFGFGWHDTTPTDSDVQPYPVLKDGDKNLVIAFVAGQFPSYVLAGESQLPEYRFADIYLTPKIDQLYQLSDSNLEELGKMLEKQIIKNEMTISAVGDSQVVLMTKASKILVYPKDDACKPVETAWGWYTDPKLMDEATPQEATPAVEPDGLDIFGDDPAPQETVLPKTPATGKDGKPVIASTTPITATAIKAPPEGKAIVVQTDNRGVVEFRSDGEFYYLPSKALHGKALKKSFRSVVGFLPEGMGDEHFAQHPVTKITGQKVKEYQGKLLKMGQSPKQLEEGPAAAKVEEKKPEPKLNVGEVRPTLHPQQVEAVKKKLETPEMKRVIDEHANDIITPEKLAQREAKFQEVAVRIGYSGGTEATVRWPIEVYAELCKNHPDAAAQLMEDYKFNWLSKCSGEELSQILTPKKQEQRDLSKLPASVRARLEKKQQQQARA